MDVREGYVTIFRTRVAAESRERALVLTAMGIEHAIGSRNGEFALAVPEHREAAAAGELDLYEAECRNWPRRRRLAPPHAFGLTGAATAVAVLLLVTVASGDGAFGLDWFRAGRVETDLVRQGEWWRAVTALTLHLGSGHLVGNLVLGSVLGVVAARWFGNGLAWFSIIVAGAVGNEVSALIQHSGHRAVGASTAVFAALGLLGAYAWRRRHDETMPWGYRWAPLIVAAVLLAMMGSGGPRTDVVSHLVGFASGGVLGAYYGSFAPAPAVGRTAQLVLGAGTVLLVAVSWAIALGANG